MLVRRNPFYKIAVDIAQYLLSNQTREDTLFDPLLNNRTPDDHYAHTFFGLLSLLLFHKGEGRKWLDAGIKSINYYLNLPSRRRGHREFNNFALLSAFDIFSKYKNEEKIKSLWSSLLDDILNMKFDAKLTTLQGNNWLALRALDHALRYEILNDEQDKELSYQLIHDYVLKWQLDDAFFYDSPRETNASKAATPLTYHAKICNVLQMYHNLTNDQHAFNASIEGLDAFGRFIAPDGESFYYGRSNNALFGYASAIYAYELSYAKTGRKKYAFYANKLASFVERWQYPDGHISISPNHHETKRCGWDDYMFSTVYNAYAAVMLLLASELIHTNVENVFEKAKDGVFLAEDSGLLSANIEHLYTAINVKGQLKRGTYHADPRYYGLSPLCLKYEGRDLIPTPPTINTMSPKFTGFLLSCHDKKYVYGMGFCDQVRVQRIDSSLCILGGGRCIRVVRHNPLTIAHKIYTSFKKICGSDFLRYPVDKVAYVVKHYYSFDTHPEWGPIRYSRIIVILPNGLIFFNLFKAMERIDVHVPLVSVRLYEEPGWKVFPIDDQTLDVQLNDDSVASLNLIYPQPLKRVNLLGRYLSSKGHCGIWEANIEKWEAEPGDVIGSSYAFWVDGREHLCMDLSPNPPEVQMVRINLDDRDVTIKADLGHGDVSIAPA